MKKIGIVLAVILCIIVVSYFGLFHYKWFGPKFENVRREVFEETKSYNQAKLQELAKYRLEYLNADDVGKQAIASTINHCFADYNANKLPAELNQFLEQIRGY